MQSQMCNVQKFSWCQPVPALHCMQVCHSLVWLSLREESNVDLEIIPKHITVQDSRVSEACHRNVGPLKEIRDNNVWCDQRKRWCYRKQARMQLVLRDVPRNKYWMSELDLENEWNWWKQREESFPPKSWASLFSEWYPSTLPRGKNSQLLWVDMKFHLRFHCLPP